MTGITGMTRITVITVITGMAVMTRVIGITLKKSPDRRLGITRMTDY